MEEINRDLAHSNDDHSLPLRGGWRPPYGSPCLGTSICVPAYPPAPPAVPRSSVSFFAAAVSFPMK